MLYELLGGRLPFQADSYADLLVKVRTQEPATLASLKPELPQALVAAVDRGLAREADKRWQTALEFGDSVRAAMGIPKRRLGGPTLTPQPAPSPAAPDPL